MIVGRNKVLPTPLNGDVLSEPGPMPISHLDAVADQFKGSQDPPGETDANGNNIPDQIDAAIDIDADKDRDRDGILDTTEIMGASINQSTLATLTDWRRSLLADGGRVADSTDATFESLLADGDQVAAGTDATYESLQDDRERNVGLVASNLESFRADGATNSAAAVEQYGLFRGEAGKVGKFAVDQFKGSQDPPGETDADGNGLPDVIDASIDTGAEHDRNNNGLMDVIESSGPVKARESEKITDLMDSLAVVDWDLDRDGVPDVMYLETVKSSTSGGVLDFSSAPADKPADLGIEPKPVPLAPPKAKVGAGLTLPVKQSNAGGRGGRGSKEQKASRGR